jgi:hypothetical protein
MTAPAGAMTSPLRGLMMRFARDDVPATVMAR